MQGPNTSTSSFKQAFLENLLLSLHARTSTDASSSFETRKRAVKSSADVAMAAARGAGARWPKAILASAATGAAACKAQRCRRIVRRCCRGRKSSSYEARRLVIRSKTMALREVIPGARDAAMDDEAALLREAMDYVVHLRAQVDVLRRVSDAVSKEQRSSSNTSVS